jgi:hypothetical protein
VLGLAGAVALTGAGSALAAYTTPKLTVADGKPAAGVLISYVVEATDDPTAKLTFYAPLEYSAALAQPAGQSIGTVTARGTAADLGGALLPLTGTVQVRAANATYLSGTTQVPIAAAATQCTGTATHTAYWVLVLQAAGQTLELPVFVDSPAAPPAPGASASAFASSSIQACLPPPDVPAGTPGRATFGFKLTNVDFRVNGVFTTAGTGQPRWRVLATPYTPLRGTPNPAGSVEVQSVIAFPRSLTLAKPRITYARNVATLAIGGRYGAPAGVTPALRLYRGSGPAATSRSVVLRASGGRYTGTLRVRQTLRRQVIYLRTRGTLPAGTSACTPTFGVACLSATRAGVPLISGSVRVVIPARKR